jgi:hypothetical protein
VDLDRSNNFANYTPSPISSINGIETIVYLTDFASNNSYETLEPHADWNQLTLSAVQNIQGYFSLFGGGATFYPGETISFKLENGTEISDFFLGVYYDQGPVGPLETYVSTDQLWSRDAEPDPILEALTTIPLLLQKNSR